MLTAVLVALAVLAAVLGLLVGLLRAQAFGHVPDNMPQRDARASIAIIHS